eukprot:169510_1
MSSKKKAKKQKKVSNTVICICNKPMKLEKSNRLSSKGIKCEICNKTFKGSKEVYICKKKTPKHDGYRYICPFCVSLQFDIISNCFKNGEDYQNYNKIAQTLKMLTISKRHRDINNVSSNIIRLISEYATGYIKICNNKKCRNEIYIMNKHKQKKQFSAAVYKGLNGLYRCDKKKNDNKIIGYNIVKALCFECTDKILDSLRTCYCNGNGRRDFFGTKRTNNEMISICSICGGGNCGAYVGRNEYYCRDRTCDDCDIVGCGNCVKLISYSSILKKYPPGYRGTVFKCKTCIKKKQTPKKSYVTYKVTKMDIRQRSSHTFSCI